MYLSKVDVDQPVAFIGLLCRSHFSLLTFDESLWLSCTNEFRTIAGLMGGTTA